MAVVAWSVTSFRCGEPCRHAGTVRSMITARLHFPHAIDQMLCGVEGDRDVVNAQWVSLLSEESATSSVEMRSRRQGREGARQVLRVRRRSRKSLERVLTLQVKKQCVGCLAQEKPRMKGRGCNCKFSSRLINCQCYSIVRISPEVCC